MLTEMSNRRRTVGTQMHEADRDIWVSETAENCRQLACKTQKIQINK